MDPQNTILISVNPVYTNTHSDTCEIRLDTLDTTFKSPLYLPLLSAGFVALAPVRHPNNLFFSRLWIIEFMLIWKTIQILISIVPEIFMQILTSSTVSEVYLSWIFHAGQTGRGGLFCLPLLSPKVAVKAEKMTSPFPAHSGNPHLSSKLLSLSKRKNSVTFTNAWR